MHFSFGLIFLLLSLGSSFAGTIAVQVTPAGTHGSGDALFRYIYSISGFTLQENQELNIRFDPARTGALSNAMAPVDFDVLLLQPNNPIGSAGDFSILALVDNPQWTGPFSVDVSRIGSGFAPQAFFLNQFVEQGGVLMLESTLQSGFVSLTAAPGAVPEPGSLVLGAAGLVFLAIRLSARNPSRGFGQS